MMSSDLATLVGSRICHDLISPIGAIGNGVELLSLTDGDTSAEMALITESVENANARIRFFRIAFGSASDTQSLSRSDVLSILSAAARGGRFTYFWHEEHDISRTEARLAFLAMQCLESSLPLGGEITVENRDGHWHMMAQGTRIEAHPDLWSGLGNGKLAVTPTAAQVQFALLPAALTDAGRQISYYIGEDRITIRF